MKNESNKIVDENISIVNSVSIKELTNYFVDLERMHGESECPTCKNKIWLVNGEDEKKPLLVTMPLTRVKGKAIWSFVLTCINCNFMKFYECTNIAKKIKKVENDHVSK